MSHTHKRTPSQLLAATTKRLEDTDVRAIFECLHEGKPPPPNLTFQIVPVGPNGLKLSPPSLEFKDGLYVLLRPRSKNSRDQPRVPPHLSHLLMKELPPETCPWSLSGPQFPPPTAIQQRYCYPKGRPEYSSRKGGALWTMYRQDNKEDVEYRLLHVYFSAKRAINKGVETSPAKRPYYAPFHTSHHQMAVRNMSSPPRHFSSPPRSLYSMQLPPNSPIGHAFDLPSPSRDLLQSSTTTPSTDSPLFTSPISHDEMVRRFGSEPTLLTPSPFRIRSPLSVFHSPVRRGNKSGDNNNNDNDNNSLHSDAFHDTIMEASFHEIDSYWQDPLFDTFGVGTTTVSRSTLACRLGVLQESIRELIFAAPSAAQPAMVHLVSDWARCIAHDPLQEVRIAETTSDIGDDDGSTDKALLSFANV